MKSYTRIPMLLAALACLVGSGPGNTAIAQDRTGTRPGSGGAADVVTVNLDVLDIVDIDNRSQVVTADLFMEVHWRDPRLAVDGEDVSEFRTYSLNEIWTPRLVIVNNRGLDVLLPQFATVDRQGSVVLRQRLAGSLAADLDLRRFPFDTQRLPIEIVSYQYSPEELVFSNESTMTARLDELGGNGWTFTAVEPEVSVFRLSETGRGSSKLTFAVIGNRDASYYAITLALPMTLIMFLAWLVHWLPPDMIPARMGMASATVFSLIALGVSFRLTMPVIGYLTAADRFVLFSTLLLIASLAVTVALVKWVNSDNIAAAVRVTRQVRWAFPALYVLILLSLQV